MKNSIVHSVPVMAGLIWLYTEEHTLNPVIVKGPDFLKFYLILILGTCLAAFFLKRSGETTPKTSVYVLFLILILGIVKLVRGISLGKPVGFLVMILIVECIVMAVIMSYHINHRKKT